ncbi:fimbria/pilus outer membrane usher protein [Sphingomonas sp. TREG-RG-20F-R18-01]|uniref:fimbria/pilus outer membrane usher protein n=1 Tax=Sphingomonas sp. TREG-RG-20F-R18-01 TaxID=2914982 RepID=UPI001F57C37D|nr:fimbria/pilus outer membrane usher protein [Sphingomonas sp. TREG-RG-20F-R18-01]
MALGTAGIGAATANPAPAGARLVMLAVRINGVEQADPAWVLRDGNVLAVTVLTARAWRIDTRAIATRHFDGDPYIAVSALPGVVLQLDDATQTLALTIPAALFVGSAVRLSRQPYGAMTRSALGGFLDYDVSAQVADGTRALNGLFALGAFRGAGTAGTSFIAGSGGPGNRAVVRLDSTYTIDDPARMRSLRIGDGVTRASTGTSALRFAGIQLASNFATQPGYLTMALPTLNGSAAVASTVDILVNNVLQNQQKVASGPFTLRDVPVVNGSGEVQLVVRDALGRQTLVTQSYYAAPQIIRRGLHDYSYEVGFLRRDYTQESNAYGAAILSATHRYGATDRITLEGHGEGSRSAQTVGLAVNVAWPAIGIFSLSAAASRSGHERGGLIGAGFERQARGISIGVSGEIATGGYTTIGETALYRHPRSTVSGFLGMPTPFGSVGTSLLWRRGRGEADVLYASASSSLRLRGIGSVGVSARRSFTGSRDSAVQVFLSVPVGHRSSAVVGTEMRNGQVGANATFQRNLPYGDGLGYRLAAETGESERFDAELNVQTNIGRLDAEATRLDGSAGARLGMSGSIATVGGRVFAARKLDQSFAAVTVGNYDNVRVYVDNQLVGRTNSAGVLIVPRLLPYQDNHLRIEAEDLPLDAAIDETARTIRPYDRSGVAVRFRARDARAGLVTVLLPDGTTMPAGTALYVNGGTDPYVVAPDGTAYLSGLMAHNRIAATIDGTGCHFLLAFAGGLGPQPRLGTFTCT